MKKYFFSILALAVAAMTTVSCSNDNDIFGEQQNKGGISFIAEMPELSGTTRTEMGYGADGKVDHSLWSAGDVITVVTDADPWSCANEFKYVSDNTAASKTAKFSMDQQEHFNNKEEINQAYYVMAYHGSSTIGYTGFNAKQKELDITLHGLQEPAKNMFDSKEDILISNAVAIEGISGNENKVYTLKFKRLSGVIRLNILPERATEDAALKNLKVSKVVMTTNDKTEDFAGKITVSVDDYSTPEIEGGEIVARKDGTALDIKPKNYKIAEEGNSIYMNVLPTTIKAGKPLTITVTAGTKTLTKEITLDKDLLIPAGKVTTLNVKFKDPDYKDPSNPDTPKGDAVVEGNVITTNGKGNLTEALIKQALTANARQLVISGNLNAADLTTLASYATSATSAFDLDLTNANIIGGENYNGGTLKNNTIPGSCFSGWNLSSLELPKSVTRIEQWGIEGVTSLTSLTIQYNTKFIGQGLLSASKAVTTLTILAGPECELQTTGAMFLDWEDYEVENLKLVINNKWNNYEGEIEGSYYWNEMYFGEAITVSVDEKGNVIP